MSKPLSLSVTCSLLTMAGWSEPVVLKPCQLFEIRWRKTPYLTEGRSSKGPIKLIIGGDEVQSPLHFSVIPGSLTMSVERHTQWRGFGSDILGTELTDVQKRKAMMPATNDANEGWLGAQARVALRRAPSARLVFINAKSQYKHNDTAGNLERGAPSGEES
ncbi:hypothetical protein B0H14DRAFT_2578648 [Mycena olivaceomarginata]|nr:hypothetical protein B0H14DRAFT_2578648 [Mycena olivaceomarginata]